MESIPAWRAGGMYLNEGRMITAEEYASGARVCMIPASMADYQGWTVGDTLEMNLYTFDSYQDDEGDQYLYGPWYGKNNDGFFDKGTYTIVGIYGQRDVSAPAGVAPEVFYQPGNTIYAPTTSAQNLPSQEEWPLQPSLLTIRLKNGTMAKYLKDMETLGLTDENDGEYTIKFYVDDQGYSKVESSLKEMNRNAKLLLGLSAALLAVTMVLTAFLFSRQHKHSVGILRMLGGSKGQAFTAILACAAVVVAAGGVVGTVLGGVLTQSVGASILGDAETAAVELATGASPVLTALTGVGSIALFLVLTAIFAATYINKEPRALLPEDKG
jgi:ABC-type antimicrobial peptide transport system permease subunit